MLELLKKLEQLSLFELNQINVQIHRLLEDPTKQLVIKKQLFLGMNIRYFCPINHALIPAEVVEIKKTRVIVKNTNDGKKYDIPLCSIELHHQNIDLKPIDSQINRYTLKIGDMVAWHSLKGFDQYGQVIKLGPKFAQIKITNGEIWKVPYSLLKNVIDAELANTLNYIK